MLFGLKNINRTFFLTLKPLNLLDSTLFVVCFFLNALFLQFLAVSLVVASAAPILLHFNVQKHHSYFPFSFADLCSPFLVFILRVLNAKYIQCALLNCWQSPKTEMLPFREHFSIENHQRYLVFYFLGSKFLLSTVLWHWKFKTDQGCFSFSSFLSKSTRHNLFVCL